uniref:Sorting nexin-24 n=1 Tax=Lepeophtheirus salmonis TaxID=72036 RepID=D3PHM1_LEPSM|nr:Sorting nexin-24 [Lepeophtheirus salmonis]
MVGMPAHVDIPHYRWAFNEKKRKYVEYRIDFWLGDGSIYVQKYARYSQLHIFHSKIRSLYRRVPEFPPKKLRNNESSFIEIRRKDLSEYLRNIVQREDLGHSLLNFFGYETLNGVRGNLAMEWVHILGSIMSNMTMYKILSFYFNSRIFLL